MRHHFYIRGLTAARSQYQRPVATDCLILMRRSRNKYSLSYSRGPYEASRLSRNFGRAALPYGVSQATKKPGIAAARKFVLVSNEPSNPVGSLLIAGKTVTPAAAAVPIGPIIRPSAGPTIRSAISPAIVVVSAPIVNGPVVCSSIIAVVIPLRITPRSKVVEQKRERQRNAKAHILASGRQANAQEQD
jgi:hypothetical protein